VGARRATDIWTSFGLDETPSRKTRRREIKWQFGKR
jgi:hypothetical protein